MIKRGLFVFSFCVAIMFSLFPVHAAEKNFNDNMKFNVKILQESTLPDSYKFTIKDECSQHDVFKQATAYLDGSFAICSSGIFKDGVRSNTNKKFVDIYDSNAGLIKEISFETTSDIAIELIETKVNIYLYSAVICYDFQNDHVNYYLTPDYEAYNSGVVDKLREKKFSKGEWTYRCDGGLLGYTRLVRENGYSEEVLFETHKKVNNKDTMISVICGVSLIAVGIKYRLSKKNQSRDGEGK